MDALPKRRSIRLPEFDYSQNGAYFVTICTQDRRELFGDICRGDPCGRPPISPHICLTPFGQAARNEISYLTSLDGVSVPAFAIMPDHVHMVILVERAAARAAPTLGQMVGAYKSKVHRSCLSICKQNGTFLGPLWQREYYDHIIRNDKDLLSCMEYIEQNPARWAERNHHF